MPGEIRCTCDDFTDSPCQIHFRENQLQDKLIKLREERDALAAALQEVRSNFPIDYHVRITEIIDAALDGSHEAVAARDARMKREGAVQALRRVAEWNPMFPLQPRQVLNYAALIERGEVEL